MKNTRSELGASANGFAFVVFKNLPVMNKPIRILLSEKTSAMLTATDERAFIVTGKATYPDDPSRWILYLVPSSIQAIDAACRVARGESLERKPRAKP